MRQLTLGFLLASALLALAPRAVTQAPAAGRATAAPASPASPASPATPATPATPSTPPTASATATPSPASTGGGAPTTAGAASADVDAGTYAVRLRDLEQRIQQLQEEVFRSKGRLSLLAETVLEGTVGGAELSIRHENRMSGAFELTRVVYLLDGAQIFPTGDSLSGEALAEAEAFDVYRGSVVPGEHTLSVTLEYRGDGHGVFSYLEGYRFTVRSTHSFTAPEGRALTLRVVGLEAGGQTTRIEDRPTVRYAETVTDELAPEAGAEE